MKPSDSLKFQDEFPDKRAVDELTREFLIESQEGLDRMERSLTELEERPRDSELLAGIFRAVHTIKGTTGFLGYARLESLSHAGESLLGMLRDGRLVADAAIISALLALLDGLRAILASIEAEDSEGEGDDRAIIARLADLQSGAAPREAAIAARTPAAVERESSQQGRDARNASTEGQPASAAPAAGPGTKPGSAPDREPESASGPTPEISSPCPAERRPETAVSGLGAAKAGRVKAQASAADSTLRVDVELLNRMMNLVGELVLTRNQILQATSANVEFAALSRRLDMVTADLREAVMKARMQPVSHVFSKFPRLVRDLSQQLGKRVRLEMEGQETELDKSLLEAIKDPLTHAVRNSIDHGIEPPEQREAAGKNAEGVVKLRAYQDGSHVVIEVVDDGGGIRVEKVREKAVERELVTEERAVQMSDRELLQLIFLPGFSTAVTVTNVSGRGVGMDVVRTNVEKIGGKAEIESHPGLGTTLRLRIPLTLAIIPALIVTSGDQSFALPQCVLHELVHLSAEQARGQIEWMGNAPLYRLREHLLPLVFLSRMLEPSAPISEPTGCFIAVLNTDGRHFGLVVDGLADPEEIVVKPLSPVLKQIGLFSGATVMGNGGVALILDPGALAARASVAAHNEQEEARDVEHAMQVEQGGEEFLLVETGTWQAALPLDSVLRIERIPRSSVEHVGRTPVLRFGDTVLPLVDASGLLDGPMPDGGGDDAPMTVVVCRDAGRQVGVAVSNVLDVASGAQLSEAGTAVVAPGITLLRDRVTRVVDLGRIPPLPESFGGAGAGLESAAMAMGGAV